MSIDLVRDSNGGAIQVLSPTNAVSVALSGTSQLLAVPADTKVLRLAATGNTWVAFGNSGVVATTSSLLFPGGVEVFSIATGTTHVACLQVGAAVGYFSINRMN
jgi:hypothetical protein